MLLGVSRMRLSLVCPLLLASIVTQRAHADRSRTGDAAMTVQILNCEHGTPTACFQAAAALEKANATQLDHTPQDLRARGISLLDARCTLWNKHYRHAVPSPLHHFPVSTQQDPLWK